MSSSTTSKPLKIMLVEDSEHDLLAFRRAINKSDLNVEITHFPRAEAALDVLSKEAAKFDILVSDYKLPGMTGLELYENLRTFNVLLPVIMLTGSGSEELAVEALKAGVDDYLVKDPENKYLELIPLVLSSVYKNFTLRLDKKRAEDAQKEVLDELRLMQFSVDQASEMIMWANSDGHYTYVNKKACECLGYDREELLSKSVWDVDEEYSPDYYKEQWLAMSQEQKRFESVYWRKDGSRFPVDVSFSQDNFEGKILSFAFIRDISERKKMEEELQKANEELEQRVNERTEELAMTVNMLQEAVSMLQQEISERVKSEEALIKSQEALKRSSEDLFDLYNHAPCGYHSLDKDGYFVRINDTELKWLGYSREEVIGKLKFTDLVSPEGIKTFNDTFPTLKSEGRVNDIEQILIRKDGTPLPVVLNATAIYDNDGNYIMSRSTVFDITEMKQTEEKLRQNDHLMMQQSRQAAMGEMIGNIAHQWRQPLNTLGLLIQQLPCFYGTEEFNSQFINTYAEDSMKLIEHMSQTIDDFRNFFKPDREKVSFDVRKLVRKTISLVEASFITQNITIKTDLEDNLFATGYPNEYCQVLLTILNNARDAFANRNDVKPLVLIKSYRENDRAVVTISDNAGGIQEKIIDRIFEPYFTTKAPGCGTGIGLYMSKTIIENNMGGILTARNHEDGAEFRIEI